MDFFYSYNVCLLGSSSCNKIYDTQTPARCKSYYREIRTFVDLKNRLVNLSHHRVQILGLCCWVGFDSFYRRAETVLKPCLTEPLVITYRPYFTTNQITAYAAV